MTAESPMSRKICFVSWHNYCDRTNGASVTIRSLFKALGNRGWHVQTFCGDQFDLPTLTLKDCLKQTPGITRFSEKQYQGACPYLLSSFRDGLIESLAFTPLLKGNQRTSPSAISDFLTLYEEYLDYERPDVVVSYGGAHVKEKILTIAHKHGCKTCVTLQNFAYGTAQPYFKHSDLTITPSRFCQDFYRTCGVESHVIPPLIDLNRFERLCDVPISEREYLLFVNPTVNKGVYWFAGIAKELRRIRPDIPILVVEGSGGREILQNADLGLKGLDNLHFTPNTPYPEKFYELSRVIMIPSLFRESFCRVAVEAMASGTAVVASNRGAIPETVGDAGVLLDIPSKYQPDSNIVPSAEEVQDWIKTILSLWDNEAETSVMVARGRKRVQEQWYESLVADRYDRILSALIS